MNAIAAKQIMKHCTGLISLNPPFNSATPRNSTHLSTQTPGPGTYNIPSLDYQKTQKYHIKLAKKSASNSFQWMFNDARSKSLEYSDNNKFIGPGSYEISRVKRDLNNGWDRSSRFSSKDQSLSMPGPGSYQYDAFQGFQKNRNPFGAIFKSKSPRTSKNLFQGSQFAKSRFYRSKTLVDEYQEQQQKYSKKEQVTSPFFASKVPRFKTESQSSQIGPGSYNISILQKSNLKPQRPCLIRASNNLRSMKMKKLKERTSSDVGPASYNLAKYEMSRVLEYKGVPLPRETRFNFSGKKKSQTKQLPGPGHYMVKKYQYLKQQASSKLRNNKIKDSIGRQMKSALKNIKLHQQFSEGPGSYDLSHNDIKSKIQKKRQFAQKLKLMDIDLPAFSSKVPRIQ